jgi:hypothetical protein
MSKLSLLAVALQAAVLPAAKAIAAAASASRQQWQPPPPETFYSASSLGPFLLVYRS